MNSERMGGLPQSLLDTMGAEDVVISDEDLADLADAFAAVAFSVHGVKPSPDLRAAVLQIADNPLLTFASRLARQIDVALEQARALLESLADPSIWEPGLIPGMFLCHLPAGPALNGALVGFVRVTAGLRFPRHTHIGEELVMVLQGGIHDESGAIYLPGDIAPELAGSTHEFHALPDEELIYLAVVQDGVDFAPEGGPVYLPQPR